MTRALTRSVLADLHTWWLKDVPNQHDIALPKSAMMRWFMQSSETDQKCWKEYGPAVEEASNMSAEEIDGIVESREDAVAAVVLLDQLPRNIFRGKEAAKAYNVYDPKARELAKKYLIDRTYTKRDTFSNFGQGYFLYMPLMHSEDLADHDRLKSLIDARRAEAQSDTERSAIDLFLDFEQKHRKVLEQFGRYPSRNDALGRKSTPEEEEHLKQGTGWDVKDKEKSA